MSKILKWNGETHTGKSGEKAFLNDLPEDTFKGLPVKEVFLKVDTIREERSANATQETIDYAQRHDVGTGEGVGVNAHVHLGGNTTCNVFVDPNFKVVTEIKTEFTSELMRQVIEQTNVLFSKYNVDLLDPTDIMDAEDEE